jgi:iron-sulfur cluster assembly protein
MPEVKEQIQKTAPISLTDGAVIQIKNLIKESNIPEEYALRVGVKGGGCSGFSYILGFDEVKEKDQIFNVKGIQVAMEKSHGLYLLGMEIDWVDGLNNRGFTFNNPNASDTCGCGESFSA